MRNAAAALSFPLDDGGGLLVVAECNHNPRPDSGGSEEASDELVLTRKMGCFFERSEDSTHLEP